MKAAQKGTTDMKNCRKERVRRRTSEGEKRGETHQHDIPPQSVQLQRRHLLAFLLPRRERFPGSDIRQRRNLTGRQGDGLERRDEGSAARDNEVAVVDLAEGREEVDAREEVEL